MSDDDNKPVETPAEGGDNIEKPETPAEKPASDTPAEKPTDAKPTDTPADAAGTDDKPVDQSEMTKDEILGHLLRESEISKAAKAYPEVPASLLEIAQLPGQAEAIAKQVTALQKEFEQKALDKVQNVDVADAKPSTEDRKAFEKKQENSGNLAGVLARRMGLNRA